MQVCDKILIHSGMHQNETGTVLELLADGNLKVSIDGWPGQYVVRPSDCYLCRSS